MQKLSHFYTKMAITSTRKVQISKFWCLKSSTSIWPSFRNINSLPKVKNMELEQKEWSKLAKIGLIFALKKLDFYIFSKICQGLIWQLFCDFQCITPIIIHWQSKWYRTGVVGGMHGWHDILWLFSDKKWKKLFQTFHRNLLEPTMDITRDFWEPMI